MYTTCFGKVIFVFFDIFFISSLFLVHRWSGRAMVFCMDRAEHHAALLSRFATTIRVPTDGECWPWKINRLLQSD